MMKPKERAVLRERKHLSTHDYPTSDGKPMAETDKHRNQMVDLIQALEDHFMDRPDVYVSGDILMFYEPGNKRRHVSPDVLAVFGVEKRERLNYLVWEEGKAPDVAFEITSSSTRHEDTVKKKELYERLGVREYFMFDPLGDYLKPRLRGYRLMDGKYVSLMGEALFSEVLGLELRIVDNVLRLFDPATGHVLMTAREALRKLREM